MTIALGADHAGFELKRHLGELLRNSGYAIIDFGIDSAAESVDYPDYATAASSAVATGAAEVAIVVCGSGIGVSITANKVMGVRAANCLTEEMAVLARLHNNANVLALGARLVSTQHAESIMRTFLETPFEGGRHTKRIEKIHLLTGR